MSVSGSVSGAATAAATLRYARNVVNRSQVKTWVMGKLVARRVIARVPFPSGSMREHVKCSVRERPTVMQAGLHGWWPLHV